MNNSLNEYNIIYDITIIKTWIIDTSNITLFTFIIKADNVNPLIANITSICFGIHPKNITYIPIRNNTLNELRKLDPLQILMLFKPLLENPIIVKITQNLKFETNLLKRYGIYLDGITYDVVLESYILDHFDNHNDISKLAKRFLYLNNTNLELDNISNIINFEQLSINSAAKYVSKEIEIIFHLHYTMWNNIKNITSLRKVFEEIDIPLVSVLSRMERIGVYLDKDILSTYSLELSHRLKNLEILIYKEAGEKFNILSTKQLQVILYNKCKLPILNKKSNGTISTNETILNKLSLMYLLPKLILNYRSLYKLKSAYVDKLIQMINPESKRIHTYYNQTTTITGRLSSSQPNLQNIPINNIEGSRIRQSFTTISPNKIIIAADYSQIELRVMAHISQDSALINSFINEKDIHTMTASEIYGIPLNEVSIKQRDIAKVINFGLIYGMSSFGLSRYLSISKLTAQEYINKYFQRYHGVWNYMNNIKNIAKKQGYVTTLEGRRIYLSNVNNKLNKTNINRTIINAPIQGTAADIIKRAMIIIDNWLQYDKLPVYMIMQVHDELIFEVEYNIMDIAINKIKLLMESCFQLDVPLKVNISIGKNWADCSQ